MIDHCIAALKAQHEQLLYRIYITDALQAVAQNTAGLAGENGVYPSRRYAEIYEDWKHPPKPDPTGDEVIAHVRNKLANL